MAESTPEALADADRDRSVFSRAASSRPVPSARRHVEPPFIPEKFPTRSRAPRKTATVPGPWELQRFDHAWGGFRAVPVAFDNDDPAVFPDDQTAIEAARTLVAASIIKPRLRLRHASTGEIIQTTYFKGELATIRTR